MKKPQVQPSLEVPHINFVNSADFKSYYCNNMRISFTSSDISLICGLLIPSDENIALVEDQFIMRVSPQTLKLMASSLNTAINGWEEAFGKLPDSPLGLSNQKQISDVLARLGRKLKQMEKPT